MTSEIDNSSKQRKSPKRTHPEVDKQLRKLFFEYGEYSVKTIAGKLHEWLAEDPRFTVNDSPSESTIRDRKKEYENNLARGVDDKDTEARSETWEHTPDQNPNDVRAILEVLAEVIERTEGRTKSFTKAEAKWIAHLHPIGVGLKPLAIFLLAREYLQHPDTDQKLALDMMLAAGSKYPVFPEVDPKKPIVNVADDDTPMGRYTRLLENKRIDDVPVAFHLIDAPTERKEK